MDLTQPASTSMGTTLKVLISTDGLPMVVFTIWDLLISTETPKMAPASGKDLTKKDLALKVSIKRPILRSRSKG